MDRLQFIRITGQTGDRIINLHNINHIEYIPPSPDCKIQMTEVLIYFIGSPVTGPLSLLDEEAEAFWYFLRAGSLNITSKFPKE